MLKQHRGTLRKIVCGLVVAAVALGSGVGAAHASVLWQENFDGRTAGSDYAGDAVVENGAGYGGSKGVVGNYHIVRGTSGNGSNRMVRNIDYANTAFDSVTLNYKINFDNDWTTTLGGKFHGVGPTNFVTGGRNVTPDGWSARVVMDGRVPYIYLYDQDKNAEFGRKVAPADRTPLSRNAWHDISLYVRLNSTGSSNDGLVELYVDGVKRTEFKNARLRGVTTADTLANKFLFSTFLGGTAVGTPLGTQHVAFDDFQVVSGKSITAIPEPAAATMLVGAGLLALRRRR